MKTISRLLLVIFYILIYAVSEGYIKTDEKIQSFVNENFWMIIFLIIGLQMIWKSIKDHNNIKNSNMILKKGRNDIFATYVVIILVLFFIITLISYSNPIIIYALLIELLVFLYFSIPFVKNRFIKIERDTIEDINKSESKSEITEVEIQNYTIVIRTKSLKKLIITPENLVKPKWEELIMKYR